MIIEQSAMKYSAKILVATTTAAVCINLLGSAAQAFTIWSGSKITFTKPTGADFNLPQNQDRLTDRVWITRGDTQGIFNIAQEPAFDKSIADPLSPVDTEWAFGTTANLGSLQFSTWKTWTGNAPYATPGKDAVLHLITDDIYIDIKFLSWDQRAGGFSYERSTSIPTPPLLGAIVGFGIVSLRKKHLDAKSQ
jgi:hypothetical protein